MLELLLEPFYVLLVWLCCLLVVTVYRLYLSPLAKFPGPKLAALTRWYETYYDTYCHGQYTFEIARMHEKYGPIVRISPWELHVNDPDFYEVLYCRTSPRNKYDYFTKQFGLIRTVISTIDHNHHRLLRANMNPYFSTSQIRSLEPLIQNLVNKLCLRLTEYKDTGKAIDIHHAYICFTTDVVSDYTMGVGFHYLDEPGFVPEWNATLTTSAKASVYMRPFPWLRYLIDALPESVLLRIFPEAILTAQFKRRCENIMKSIMDEQSAKDYGQATRQFSHPTFFHDVLNSALPPEEKSPERLSQEVQLVIGAGSESTSKMLAWTTFYLLENTEKLHKLKEELNRLDPDYTASLVDFEKMPYLTSVMLEGLRLSYGISSRLPRIAPDTPLQCGEWTIPAGTPVEMTSVLMHHNEKVFPDSYSFIPERWLDLGERKRLEKYMVSFSKGSRQCLGMNLAKAEILLLLPKICREFEFELFETTREDVTIAHDLFLPYPREDSKGVRVLVH